MITVVSKSNISSASAGIPVPNLIKVANCIGAIGAFRSADYKDLIFIKNQEHYDGWLQVT